MIRLAPHDVREQLRIALLVAPPSLRSAYAGDALERHPAVDRLAAILAEGLAGLELFRDDAMPAPAPQPALPLFGEDMLPPPPAAPKLAFARWLLDQQSRTDAIGELAKAAARDPGYPRHGGFKEVSARLNTLGADGDVHATLEDAELDWLAL
jgi:hypothetical protein